MLSKIYASAVHGVEATTITVEVNLGGRPAEGQKYTHMVGLPDNAVKEGFQRIEAAITNAGYIFPKRLTMTFSGSLSIPSSPPFSLSALARYVEN